MTTYSKSDLATRVLKELGIVDSREDPDPEDLDWAEETVGSVVEQLANQGIVIVNGSADVVPEGYLVQLAKRIALDLGPSFGLFTLAQAELAKEAANVQLRRMNAKSPTGSVVEVEYY